MFNNRVKCRTCDFPNDKLLKLETNSITFPETKYNVLLQEVTKLQVQLNSGLPNDICIDCVLKLEAAYAFIIQAQKLDHHWKSETFGVNSSTEECLVEAPIDLPSKQNFCNYTLAEDIENISFNTPTNGLENVTINNFNGNQNDFIDYPGDLDQDEFGRACIDNDPITMESCEIDLSDERIHIASGLFESDIEENEREEIIKETKEIFEELRKIEEEAENLNQQTQTIEDLLKGACHVDASCNNNKQKRIKLEQLNDMSSVLESESSKKKRGRPRQRDLPEFNNNVQANEKGQFACSECQEEFALRKDLENHYQDHLKTKGYYCCMCNKSFGRKANYKKHQLFHRKYGLLDEPNTKRSSIGNAEWLFGNYLYSEKPFSIRQCILCNATFSKSILLHNHLLEHSKTKELEISLSSPLVKERYQNCSNLWEITENIYKKLEEKDFEYCFLIRNHFGYEMSLSDSDESDNDDPNKYENVAKSYFCIICQINFNKKHKIYSHMRDTHKYDTLPFKCSICKLGFCSERMFNHHLLSQCRNKCKTYKCSKCPGKFAWKESLTNHYCVNRFDQTAIKKKSVEIRCDVCDMPFKRLFHLQQHKNIQHNCEDSLKECNICLELLPSSEKLKEHQNQKHRKMKYLIKCCLCTERFIKLNDLRKHLPIHSDGITKCNPKKGLFYKSFYPEATEEQLQSLSITIAEDFKASNLVKYYFAADEEGYEMDLNDSGSDDNIDNTSQSKYLCDICMNGFSHLKDILEHQNTAHASAIEDFPHCCNNCSQRFISLCLLERHLKRDCNSILPNSFRCETCNQNFIWTESFKIHLELKHCNEEEDTLFQSQNLEISKQIVPNDQILNALPKYDCPYCDLNFNRQDSLNEHLKSHENNPLIKKEARSSKPTKYTAVDEKLCKPNGCKQVQCMICLSKHSKVTDLRAHLLTHEYIMPLISDHPANVAQLVEQFYPNEGKSVMSLMELIKHIKTDIQAKNFERFYSITNEVGYELQLSSSETETDSESDYYEDDNQDDATQTSVTKQGLKKKRTYNCELCNQTFERKYLVFKHHKDEHAFLDAKYSCGQCQARFLCEELLNHHYATQCRNNRKRFSCRKCPLRFMWQENFRNHTQQHMDEEANQKKVAPYEKPYECVECDRSFLMLKDLTRHMVMHNSSSYTLKCHWCPRKFYRKSNLIMHIQRHGIQADKLDYAASLMKFHYNPHGKKEIYCKICKVKFHKISSLRKHLQFEDSVSIKTHHNYNSMWNYSIINEWGFELDLNDSESDEDSSSDTKASKEYKCEICNLVFKRKYRMSLHQQSVHKYETLPLKCDRCLFKTVSKDILSYHKRTHCDNKEKTHECPKCSFHYMWEDNLDIHLKLLHNIEPIENLSHAKEKGEFQCEQCHCKYNRKDRLATHVRKRHPIEPILLNETITKVEKDLESSSTSSSRSRKKKPIQSYLCAFCGKAVTSSSNLIIHMRRHTGEKPFKCDFCEMAFPRSSDLQCHRRTHTGEKPHQCTICEKSFARSYKLYQHMRIHSGEKPYKCSYCEKCFTQSNDLTLHIRRHTGERPYICGICGERFIQGTALRNHRLMRGHFEEVQTPKTRAILKQF